MIRKQTWVLLGVFVVLLGAVFYLQKNPLPTEASATPSVTVQPPLLPGWKPEDITGLAIHQGQAETMQLAKDAQGRWALEPGTLPVEAGKVEQLRAQITDLRAIATLGADFDASATGLSQPALTLNVWNTQGQELALKIGGQTPIETGYYVQLNDSAPVVVSKFAVDALLEQAQREKLANITPTSEATAQPVGTVNPHTVTPSP